VATSRRPLIRFEEDLTTLAGDWPELAPLRPQEAAFEPEGSPSVLGTVAMYPLQTRGQFLGILAVGRTIRFGSRHLAALEDLADLAALAATTAC
jgi:GAF domain-containing protein